MELYFCDLCQEAVPQADLDAGRATHLGERTVCQACHAAMDREAAEPAPPGPGASAPDGPEAGPPAPQSTEARSARPPVTGTRRLVGPGLAAALGASALLLTLVAVVALLARIELASRASGGRAAVTEERLGRLEERVAGTRDGAQRLARDAAESAVLAELERMESMERQLRELRALLGTGAAEEAQRPDRPAPAVDERGLVLPGDAMERVDELEEQLLFLQARVHDLLQAESRRAEGRGPVERLELPEGEVGQLVAQLGHEDPIERVAALYSLALVEDPGIAGHLVPLLKDPDAYVRALSARILEQLEARSAVQPLIDALADPEVVVRQAAVTALRRITGRQFGFDPRGTSGERFAGARRWREWWAASWKTFLYGDGE
jgi:hypothetical protein